MSKSITEKEVIKAAKTISAYCKNHGEDCYGCPLLSKNKGVCVIFNMPPDKWEFK